MITIEEQKLPIKNLLADIHSLKYQWNILTQEAYQQALKITKVKTKLDNLPESNPFDLDCLD